MDEWSEKIERLLSSPEGLAKIRSVMDSLGGSGAAVPLSPQETPPAPPTEAFASPGGSSGALDPALLQKVLPLMNHFGQDDDDTRLLYALRPYLQGEREKRLDETVRLLRLARLLPLLQTEEKGSGKGSGKGG